MVVLMRGMIATIFSQGFLINMVIVIVWSAGHAIWKKSFLHQKHLNAIYDLHEYHRLRVRAVRWQRWRNAKLRSLWSFITLRGWVRGELIYPVAANDRSLWQVVKRTEGGRIVVERRAD